MARPLDRTDFKTPGRGFLSESPAIIKLARQFETSCRKALEAMRGVPWQGTLDAMEDNAQLPADDAGRHIRFESAFGSLTAHLFLDRAAISAVIEAAMGGTGAEDAFNMNERPLSRIESRLIARFEVEFARRIAAALTGHLSEDVRVFDGETPPELSASSGALFQLRYLINVFSYSGEIRLSFARSELEQQIRSLEAKLAEDANAVLQKQLQSEVSKSDVVLTVTLGTEILSLEDISGLRPGRLIELSSTVSSPVTLWSGSVAAFHGRLARNGDRLAVAISAAIP